MRVVLSFLIVVIFVIGTYTTSTGDELTNTKSVHILRCWTGTKTKWTVFDGGQNVIRVPYQNSVMNTEFVVLAKDNVRIGVNWTHVYNTDERKSWSVGDVLSAISGLKFVPRYRVIRSKIGKYSYVLAEDKAGELGSFLYVTLNTPENGNGLIVLSATAQNLNAQSLLTTVTQQLDFECLASGKD